MERQILVGVLLSRIYMLFLIYIQNLTAIGRVVSEIICGTKNDINDRGTDGNGRSFFSGSMDHETSRKHESGNSSNGSSYNTSLAYTREVEIKADS